MMKFSEILKDLMEEKNYNQVKLEKASGIPQRTISAWLLDRSKPGYDNLIVLSKVFNVSADILLGLSDY